MAYFPIFIDLQEQNALVIGGGKIASDKVEKLLPYGTKITVIAPDVICRLGAIQKVHASQITFVNRAFQDEDLVTFSPKIVIAATDDRPLNAHISALCNEAKIPCNVVDDQEYCSFLFASLVRKGDLSIGISTGGKSPAAAVYARRKIEKIFPESIDEIISYLGEIRPEILEKYQGKENAHLRHLIFGSLFEVCMDLGRPLTREEFEAVVNSALEDVY